MSSTVKSVSFTIPAEAESKEEVETQTSAKPKTKKSSDKYYDVVLPPLRVVNAKYPKFQVYGYAMTMIEIMHWAIDRKFREDIRPPASCRINPAIKEILKLLPYKYKPGFEFVEVMDYEKDKAGVPCICFFFASNVSEKARRQARRKDLTHQYQEILGVTGMPKWYTPYAVC